MFCCRLTIGDETWIHHWNPESTLESMQWKHPDYPPPKKFRTQLAAGTSYDNNFGDSEKLHMVDYLASKKTIIGQYYAEITFKLYDAMSQKRWGKLSSSVWLLHDNAPVHKLLVAQQAVLDCVFLQLNHTAYSPDLAPSDCYLFRHLKSQHHGIRVADNESPKADVEAGFEGQDEEFFFQGINSLPEQKSDKNALTLPETIYESVIEILRFIFLYRSCKTF